VLTKILFTALVIAVVLATARFRARMTVRSGLAEIASPHVRRNRMIAYGVAGALVISAVGGYALYWMSWNEPVTVRVINTQSGELTTYQVRQGSIHDREFETVDGWTVAVSEQERMEIARE
jgi:galactokinase/mevalonate kinase-like predicted kinase